MSRQWIALILMAWVPLVQGAHIDKSDLNGDGVVNDLDLQIFADLYFEEPYEAIDWCAFYESSMLNEKYFRRIVSDQIDHYAALLSYIADSKGCEVVQTSSDMSDLNSDGVVDLEDLALFSINYLERSWETVDWCVFHGATMAGADFEGQSTKYYQQHFTALLDFINEHFNCGGVEPPPNNFALENNPQFLGRIADATGITGNYYVSDPRVGSVFIYNELMALTGELKGLNKPLGVAVDAQGRIIVGNNGRDNIEVYDSGTGELVAAFGEGSVEMPTAITIDSGGYVYVTDSRKNRVFVFDAGFNLVRTIGKSGVGDDTLNFPMDAAIIQGEIFVADQKNLRVQVYDLAGEWQRSITFDGTPGQNCSWFTGVCEIPGMPPFTRVQALATDSLGRLHVLDNYGAAAVILDPADGSFINAYGGYGSASGQLQVPMDVSVSATDMAIVTAGDGDRIEFFTVPQ
jgi:DNA-binding beta-propeller fold protein YncE